MSVLIRVVVLPRLIIRISNVRTRRPTTAQYAATASRIAASRRPTTMRSNPNRRPTTTRLYVCRTGADVMPALRAGPMG